MGKAGCAASDCKPSKTDSRHSFPNPEKYSELFKKWLIAINNKILTNLSNKYIFQHYRVCTKHFTKEDLGPNNVLKRGVCPTLFLRVATLTDNRGIGIEEPTPGPGHQEIPELSVTTLKDQYASDNECMIGREQNNAETFSLTSTPPSQIESSNICRICLISLCEDDNYINIFDQDGKAASMLLQCASVVISENDGLTKFLCGRCAETLNIAHNFKKQCEDSDAHLRGQLKRLDCETRRDETSPYNETDGENVYCDTDNEWNLREAEKKEKETLAVKSKFSCEVCGKNFVRRNSLNVHLKHHEDKRKSSGTRQYKCIQCLKCFFTSDSLSKHMRRHTGEKPHLCSTCGKGFGAASTLHIHMRIHSGEKPLQCPSCPMRFAAQAGLSVHLRKHTGERPYLCSNCGQSFKSSSDLTIHFRTHTGEKPYSCDLCDKKFRTSYMRLMHRRWHTGEKPAKCKICQKSFTSNGHLNMHMRTHATVKPYRCTSCDRAFITSKDLDLHTMVHTGVKPHMCPHCNKGFNRSNNLAKHMRLHLGLKPHTCEVCKNSFSTSSQLKIHIRSHTGERPYTCSLCRKSFVSSGSLARHKRHQHMSEKVPVNS